MTSEISLTRVGGSPPRAPASRLRIIFGARGVVALVICKEHLCIRYSWEALMLNKHQCLLSDCL